MSTAETAVLSEGALAVDWSRAEDADKVRCSVMHGGFRRVLRRNGYFNVKSTLDVSVKINAVQVPRGFYDETDGWHITYGDSDQDH
jgi:hypothetical protein